MKLVAIINVWADSIELLPYCVKAIAPHVDGVVICSSTHSNRMEVVTYTIPHIETSTPIYHIEYTPLSYISAQDNERTKRNYALNYAKTIGTFHNTDNFTHVITMDSDEFYTSEDIGLAKHVFAIDDNIHGVVVPSMVYFNSPKLTIGIDRTLVPFIHKITPELKYDFNRHYPYAWVNGQIRIDPTRSFNIIAGIGKKIIFDESITLHHYSWIRKDFELKIRNSSAQANLERSTIRQDLKLAKAGYFCQFYQRHLVPAQVDFGIPDFSENVDSKDNQPL